MAISRWLWRFKFRAYKRFLHEKFFKYLGTIQMGSEMAIFAYYQYIEVGWIRKGPKTCLCNIWIVPYLVIIQTYWKENFFYIFWNVMPGNMYWSGFWFFLHHWNSLVNNTCFDNKFLVNFITKTIYFVIDGFQISKVGKSSF